uniref:Bee-milk protein n=1 Tax=Clastoptera arizonana TaxID=38151 RepID=A0A1B6DFI2_9HEMI
MDLHISILFAILISGEGQHRWSKINEVLRWKQVDYQLSSDRVRNELISSRRFIPENNSMLGLEVWRDKVFITVPRWYQGVVATLNYVNLNSRSKSPPLIPYPDYTTNDIHSGDLNNKIISTTRIFVDSCNRLWVPDNGQEGISTGATTRLSSHKLFVFDLNTNRLLKKIAIGRDVAREQTLFYEVAVEVTNNDCSRAFAYLADTVGYGLVVYSYATDSLTRISNTYLYFEPQNSVFNNVQFNDGIMGIALSQTRHDGFRTMYFHALASYNEYNVSTQVLRDPTLSGDFTRFKLMGSRGEKGQSTTQRLDEKTGVLFYTQVMKNGIGCWNSKMYPNEYSTATNGMVVVDRTRITFPSALTLDSNRDVWVLSNNLLSFGARTMNPKDFNYRIYNASVESLIKDTMCDVVTEPAASAPQIWSK